MKRDLTTLSKQLWPTQDDLRSKWLQAVELLRTKTTKGWIIDGKINRGQTKDESKLNY